MHRFANRPVASDDGLHWDVQSLFDEIKRGLTICCERHGRPSSVGIDTWGIDFALLDEEGQLLFQPFHYRDRRTEGMMAEAFKRVPRREIFEQTGIQFLPFNTLYQLLSMALAGSPHLARAKTFLTIPDLLNFWLTGRAVCEFTNATTTQFYDPRAGGWATSLLERLGIPTHFLPEVVMPGTVLGPLLPSIAETGGGEVPVVAPACHDTGSAVAAVPADRDDFAYISSGTWSCVGVEVREPIISDAALAANVTNEGGVRGSFRLLRNVAGLWLLQECRRVWAAGGTTFSYEELAALAEQAPAVRFACRPGRFLVSQPAGHAGSNRRVLPTQRPAGAFGRRGNGALRAGEPRAQVPLGHRAHRGSAVEEGGRHPHRGRRLAK